jgi:hypothetical protein
MSRLTKLQACNLVLSAAGLAPVNTIDTPTNLSASLVVQLLDAEQRRVLVQGWHFNTEFEVGLEVDINTGTIPVGAATLRCEVPDMPWVVMRGLKLYDRNAHSDQFEEGVTAKVVKWIVWDELSEEAKTLITAQAALRFAATHKPSNDVALGLLRDDMVFALAALQESDAEDANYSIFDEPGLAVAVPIGNQYVPGAPRGGYDTQYNRTQN